jgi:hypothetical protein
MVVSLCSTIEVPDAAGLVDHGTEPKLSTLNPF